MLIYCRQPPKVRIEPDRQTVSQGSIAELHCLPSGDQHVTIHWSKAGDVLPSNVQVHIHYKIAIIN